MPVKKTTKCEKAFQFGAAVNYFDKSLSPGVTGRDSAQKSIFGKPFNVENVLCTIWCCGKLLEFLSPESQGGIQPKKNFWKVFAYKNQGT